MQLKIVKQEISHSFIFQNQHIYYNSQKKKTETFKRYLVESQKQAVRLSLSEKILKKSILINA